MAKDKKCKDISPDQIIKLSFEDELTFAPKLNSHSRKIASESNRTSIMERPKAEKKLIENMDYSFQPRVSSRSSKIVARLKTSFIERQNKHSFQHIDTTRKQNPFIRSPTNTKVLQNSLSESNSLKLNSNINIPNEAYSKSDDSLLNKATKKQHKIRKIIFQTSQSIANTSLSTSTKNEITLALPTKNTKRQSEKNYDENNEEVEASCNFRKKHERSLTYPLPGKERLDMLVESHQQMLKAKKIAAQAIKKKKIFLCNGPYKNIRNALRQRGWIEKNFKADPTYVSKHNKNNKNNEYNENNNENIEENSNKKSVEENNNEVENNNENENESATNINNKNENESNANREDINETNKNNKNKNESESENFKKSENKNDNLQNKEITTKQTEFADEFLCDDQYGIMSRVVRNSTPTFIWTLRRDDIDFRFLQKDQMVNHYMAASSFTTKAGLCKSLHNVRYFEDLNSLTFFPRCYRLCCDEERQTFLEDFRITAVQGILKVLIEQCQEWKLLELKIYKELAEPKEEDEVNKSFGEDVILSSPTKKDPIILSVNVFNLILRACYGYLDMKEHKDIEEEYNIEDRDISDITWKTIVDYYYQISRGEAIISNAWKNIHECKSILRKMDYFCPQLRIDGHRNLWILKPGAKSRGRGIEIKNRLDDILNLASDNVSKKENRWVIQKYIEQPYLIYRTKFDIRQWFLVTDWNPLTLWFYKDCYIRFCCEEFTMDKFGAKFHLSNNSVQKHFKNGERSEHLPDSNMWSNDTFKKHLFKRGYKTAWDDIIYPGMKESIIATLQSCQDALEYRKNSFQLYGADFMLSEDLHPWLIEINSSPALGASTPVTEKLCNNVIEDTLKVVLDKRLDRNADTGRFELAYKQQYISIPNYMGCNISVEGTAVRPPVSIHAKSKVKAIDLESIEENYAKNILNQKEKSDLENSETPILEIERKSIHNLSTKKSEVQQIYESISSKAVIYREKSEPVLPDIPIEKIKKRHSNLAGLIKELKSEERLRNSTENQNIPKIGSDIPLKNSIINTPRSISNMSSNNNFFGLDWEDSRKDFLDYNIQKVKSKHNPTYKLKFKKPIKEIKTKVRYSKQFGMMENRKLSDNSADKLNNYDSNHTKLSSHQNKYDSSIAKQMPLTHS